MAIVEDHPDLHLHAKANTVHPPMDPSLAAFYEIAAHPAFPALLDYFSRLSTLDASEVHRIVGGMRAVLGWRARAAYDGQAAIDAVMAADHGLLATATRRLDPSWDFADVTAEDIGDARAVIALFQAAINMDKQAAIQVAAAWNAAPNARELAFVHAATCLADPRVALITPWPDKPREEAAEPCCDACAHGTGACEGSEPAPLEPDGEGTFAFRDPWRELLARYTPRTCATGSCPTR